MRKSDKNAGYSCRYLKLLLRLHHTANRYVHDVVDGELFAADVEGVGSIGAVGAVFEQVFF